MATLFWLVVLLVLVPSWTVVLLNGRANLLTYRSHPANEERLAQDLELQASSYSRNGGFQSLVNMPLTFLIPNPWPKNSVLARYTWHQRNRFRDHWYLVLYAYHDNRTPNQVAGIARWMPAASADEAATRFGQSLHLGDPIHQQTAVPGSATVYQYQPVNTVHQSTMQQMLWVASKPRRPTPIRALRRHHDTAP